MSLIQKVNAHRVRNRLFSEGRFVGYHLDVEGKRYWIGKTPAEAESNLESAVTRFADRGNNHKWYIERLDGFCGNQPMWSNLDHTDSII